MSWPGLVSQQKKPKIAYRDTKGGNPQALKFAIKENYLWVQQRTFWGSVAQPCKLKTLISNRICLQAFHFRFKTVWHQLFGFQVIMQRLTVQNLQKLFSQFPSLGPQNAVNSACTKDHTTLIWIKKQAEVTRWCFFGKTSSWSDLSVKFSFFVAVPFLFAVIWYVHW